MGYKIYGKGRMEYVNYDFHRKATNIVGIISEIACFVIFFPKEISFLQATESIKIEALRCVCNKSYYIMTKWKQFLTFDSDTHPGIATIFDTYVSCLKNISFVIKPTQLQNMWQTSALTENDILVYLQKVFKNLSFCIHLDILYWLKIKIKQMLMHIKRY